MLSKSSYISSKPYFGVKDWYKKTLEGNIDIIDGGDNNNLQNILKLETTKNETLLYKTNPLISGYEYNTFLDKIENTIEIYNNDKSEYKKLYKKSTNLLYDYLLVSTDESKTYDKLNSKKNDNTKNNTKILITKYNPISPNYYIYHEIFTKFNLLTKNNKNVLYFGYYLTPIEYLKFNNYKFTDITSVVPAFGKIELKNVINEWNKYLYNIKKIYNIKTTEYNGNIYTMPLENISKVNAKYNIVIYNIYDLGEYVYMYENFINIPNLFVGSLIGLKYTELNGIFIINLGSVAYKPIADIYLILSKYFKESNLYYPDICNLYNKSGTYGIFKGFKGISKNEYDELIKLLNKIQKLYPDGSNSFNIYTNAIRENFKINKPINNELAKNYKQIIGFLNYKYNDPIYNEIRLFNENRYIKQSIYMNKLLKYINIPLNQLNKIVQPTEEQIINAILYCKKWDIAYFDKFSNTAFKDKFGKQILHEAYGLHKPIEYNFKTPFKLHIQSASKSLKLISSINKSITKSIKSRKTKKSKSKNSDSFNISDFFSKLSGSKTRKKTKIHNKKHSRQISSKHYTEFTTNLIPELEFSNNRIEQTTKLIDSRRDFDAPEEKMQNLKWFEANKQFRYYKHKDDKEKIHLDVLVRDKLKDNSISQAWLKMYEIITDCNIVSTGRKGTFKSFHICEAPGTFINCLNNYIHTKTKYDNFEWKAQSLCDNNRNCGGKGGKDGTAFGDDFGLIRRHKDRWNWGADETGDITHINNIQHYAKLVKAMNETGQSIDLMTSDCGLPMKSTGYEKVAFASFLAILHILPKGGTMVYKILSPIDEPIIYNLIYIAYTNFKDLIFYKPVQNSQSREFYIIGKGYLGTELAILDRFFDVLKNFKEGQEIDLFGDEYPEAFVRQMVQSSTELADNFVYTIERQIYFVDNEEMITPDFIKLLKTYYDEKNKDWIDKYKPMRLENYKDKL